MSSTKRMIAGFLSAMERETINRLDTLQALLRAPLNVTVARNQLFPSGAIMPAEVVVTHRLLLILEGAMDYTVEGKTRRLEAGVQFFVPAWCRRKWRVPKNGRACRLLWCEFSSGAVTVPAVLCWRSPPVGGLERTGLERLCADAAAVADGTSNERVRWLRQEGELKACLARFWPEAQDDGAGGESSVTPHREVTKAVAWLERHFAEPDALEAFYKTVELSPNHFRLLFKRQTGETVQVQLARLRLRRARYLVQATTLPMKRIAAETGHADPLYFSLQYRRFWGRTATTDRRTGGMA